MIRKRKAGAVCCSLELSLQGQDDPPVPADHRHPVGFRVTVKHDISQKCLVFHCHKAVTDACDDDQILPCHTITPETELSIYKKRALAHFL